MEMTASTEITRPTRVFNDDELAAVSSFDSVLEMFKNSGIVAETIADYGNGFSLIEDKDKSRLVNVPFVILQWKFTEGDFGTFVSAEVVTKAGEKLILNDGSTGICAQLTRVSNSRVERGHATPQAGLLCEKGLTRSDYTTDIPNAKGELVPTKATTFYLAE